MFHFFNTASPTLYSLAIPIPLLENRKRHFLLLDPERGVKFLSSDQKVLTDTTVLDGYLVRKLTQDYRLTLVICDAIRCNGVDLTGLGSRLYLKFVMELLGWSSDSRECCNFILKIKSTVGGSGSAGELWIFQGIGQKEIFYD